MHVAEHDQLAAYAPAAWAACLDQLIDQIQPDAVVAAGTNRGNEVLAHLAARRDLPFAANCIAVGSDGAVTRVRWGGTLLEEARINSELKLLSVAPHMVEATTVNGGAATVERFEPELGDEVVRVVEHAETPPPASRSPRRRWWSAAAAASARRTGSGCSRSWPGC